MEESKITIEEFIEEIEKTENLEKYMDSIILNDKYLSCIEKKTICENIVKASSVINYKSLDVDKSVVKFNSYGCFILYVMEMINIYTRLKVDFEDNKYAGQFDLIEKAGLTQYIMSLLPEEEKARMDEVLNMEKYDFYQNNYTVNSLVETKLSAFENVFGIMLTGLNDVFSNPNTKKIIDKLTSVIDE